jgi:hypothetical protein
VDRQGVSGGRPRAGRYRCVSARPVPGSVVAAALAGSRVAECEDCGDLIWSTDGVDWEHMDTDEAECSAPPEPTEEEPDGDEAPTQV